MKSTFRVLIIITLALASFGQSTTASAAEVIKGKTMTVDANLSSVDDSGCVVTQMFVYAFDSLSKNPPGPGEKSSFVYLSMQQFDICTNFGLLYAEGSAWLDDDALVISGKQDQATLDATISMFEWYSQTSWEADIDLTWIGTGALIREKHHDQYVFPGCQIRNRWTGLSREFVESSGTISNGLTNFNFSEGLASINSAKTSEIHVGCRT